MPKYFLIAIGVFTVAFFSATAAVFGMMNTKILLLAVAAVIGGLGVAASGNTRLSMLYATIFLAPWNIKKNFMFFGHLTGASAFELHISDPFLLVLVLFLLRDLATQRRASIRFPPALLFWVALMAGGVVSIFSNQVPLPPAHEVFRMTRWLLWIVVIVNEVVRRKQFLHVGYALLVAAAAQTLFAYFEVFGINLGLTDYGQMTEQGVRNLSSVTLQGDLSSRRIGGIMLHPNVLGAYLALHSGVALALLFTPIGWLQKFIISCLLASFVPIIVLTLSRAAWVDFAVVVLLVTVLTNTHRYARLRYTVLRTAILTGIVIVAIAFSGPIITRLTQSAPGAVDTRMEFIITSWKMIKERPLLGWGLNTITFYQAPYTTQGSVNAMIDFYGTPDEWPVVHNSYMLVWVEQGTVGLLLWLSLHGAVILTGFRNLKTRDPTLHALNVGFLAGYIAILIDCMVSFFDRIHQGGLIWTFAALIFAIAYWRRANESEKSFMRNMVESDQPPVYSGLQISRNSGFIQGSPPSLWLLQPSQTTLKH